MEGEKLCERREKDMEKKRQRERKGSNERAHETSLTDRLLTLLTKDCANTQLS